MHAFHETPLPGMVILWFYTVLDTFQVRLVAASVLAPLNIVLAVLVIKEFGWLEFRIVGASDALQRKTTFVQLVI